MNDFPFRVEVVRTSRKKSVSIQVEPGLVRLRAPHSTSDAWLRDLLVRRSRWIATKLKELSERPETKPREGVSGEIFPCLGRDYRLQVLPGAAHFVAVEGDELRVTVKESAWASPNTAKDAVKDIVKHLLTGWYRQRAEEELFAKTERLAKVVAVTPRSVMVRSYKSRWGSCSINGDIRYNWHLIFQPHPVVDYVVVHELCHLLEHNHSPKYWAHVERHIPNWREYRDWLKKAPVVF